MDCEYIAVRGKKPQPNQLGYSLPGVGLQFADRNHSFHYLSITKHIIFRRRTRILNIEKAQSDQSPI